MAEGLAEWLTIVPGMPSVIISIEEKTVFAVTSTNVRNNVTQIGFPNDKSPLAKIEGLQKSQQRLLPYVLCSVLIL